VISTHKKDKVHRWFAEKAPSLGLAAEDGFFWRPTNYKKSEHDWIKLIKNADIEWK
jgi:trehalose-6-phosphatase